MFAISRYASRPCHRARGFSLLELSVVMAVFGLFMAGVWGLSGVVRDGVRQTKFSSMLLSTVRNVRSFYARDMNIRDMRTNVVMQDLLDSGAFPGDSVVFNAGVPTVLSPFGAVAANPVSGASPYRSFYVCGWQTDSTICSFAGGVQSAPLFAVEVLFATSDVGSCMGAVVRNSNPAQLPGLVAVKFNGAPAGIVTLPISPAAARIGCQNAFAAGVAVVDFIFKINP